MTPRYYVAPDDWPLWSGHQWWCVYDSHHRVWDQQTQAESAHGPHAKVNPEPGTFGWRYGSERKAQRVADKLNRL